MIDGWIAKLKEHFDPDTLEEARDRMASAWNFKPVDRPPISITVPPPEPWPSFEYSERFYDLDKMLLHQLAFTYSHYLLRDDGIPCVRADYGTGIVASGFGSEVIVRRGLDQMPWVKEPILKSDPPDISELRDPDPYNDGLMAKVIEAEKYFLEKLEGTGVSIYLCDTQSPIDTAYLLRGTKLFKDFYMYPEFAEELLKRIAEVYVEFSIIQKKIIGEPLDRGVHGSPNVWMGRGGVRVCEDVAVMLSPSLYRRFCTPANKICLEPFDGGMDHFCCSNVSDGKQVLDEILSNQYIRAFFFGNPSRFYDFEETLKLFHSRRVCLIWTDGPRQDQPIDEWVKTIADAMDRIGERTGVIFSINVESFDKARKIMDAWKESFR